jgi:cytochrome c biogenesis protein ResB
MRASLSAAVCACGLLTASLVADAAAQTLDANRISGPLVHENLAVYFIHGGSAPGTVPLTLEEAMASGAVKVRETSNVNQLDISAITRCSCSPATL